VVLRTTLGFVAVLAALVLGASTAGADSGTIPDTPDLPWTDPSHRSPLEQLASNVASAIAARPVRVYCNGQNDWDTLATTVGFDGARIWGYVAAPRYWYPTLGTFAEDSTHTQLATKACERLWQFAKATTKPTRCAASRVVVESKTVSVPYTVRVKARTRKRVRVNGRWVTRSVMVNRSVTKRRLESRTVTRNEPAGLLPCYSGPPTDVVVSSPPGGFSEYSEYIFAIATLAHESIHLRDFTAGQPVRDGSRATYESRAECLGMQNIAAVAVALGAGQDDAANITRWYWENYYPTRQTQLPDYWSADCRAGGALDATPADGIWP
jgi:hypothetical protein